ncbi:MAG: 2-hydroxychromene-2-carboxylate isomerase [Alphaproteobacteria bacterium]|jgi:2-hydroxychromene-2-carboxylate isomerase|nr:2-hydroxychromene-2-carboxylate isomerase [Alphaproteobacteria bacterium]
MPRRLEFFFDCSSPWTYLAFSRVHDVIKRTGAVVEWKPILVGGVFNAVNQDVYERRANPDPRKGKYYAKDLADWARFAGLKIGRPPVFPVNSVKAMRGALIALDDGKLVPYATAVFQAYWGDLLDISQTDILGPVAAGVGYEPASFLKRIEDPALKNRLRANTDELIARGGFGSPTMFVDGDDMYFGNDRLPLLEAALARKS